MVQKALKAFEDKGVQTEIVFLGDLNISGCTGCEGCRETFRCIIKDDMQELYDLLLEADGVILGSPTYFYNVTADMKAFIDRCYCLDVFHEEDRSVWLSIPEVLGGKYAVVIAICEQLDEKDMGVTPDVMASFLRAIGYRVVDTVKALHLFKAGEASGSTALLEAQKAGEKLYKTITLRKKIEERVLLSGK